MKINLDDPNLTAFALGELAEPKRSAMAAAVAESSDAQQFVSEMQELAGMVRGEFRRELEGPSEKPSNILPLPQEPSFWSDSRWGSLAVAALLAICAIVAAVMLSGREQKVAKRETVLQMELESGRVNLPPARGATLEQDGFVSAAASPISTFALNVETASYENVRSAIEAGSLPPKEAVQIEGMINAFSYDYPEPAADQTFAILVDAVTCPWNTEHRLVRIAVNPRDDARPVVARNAKVQVEVNPRRVTAYRLMGYENMTAGTPSTGDNSGGEEVRGGRAVTALYEIVPIAHGADTSADSMVTARVSHADPESGRMGITEQSVGEAVHDFASAPADLKFAVAVAEFGLILRGSPHVTAANLGSVLASAEAARGRDMAGNRASFVEVVRKARTIVAAGG